MNMTLCLGEATRPTLAMRTEERLRDLADVALANGAPDSDGWPPPPRKARLGLSLGATAFALMAGSSFLPRALVARADAAPRDSHLVANFEGASPRTDSSAPLQAAGLLALTVFTAAGLARAKARSRRAATARKARLGNSCCARARPSEAQPGSSPSQPWPAIDSSEVFHELRR